MSAVQRQPLTPLKDQVMIIEKTHRAAPGQRTPSFRTDETLDLAWGAREIARLIGKTPRATFHLLEQGQIPARKIGNQWVASRRKLRDHFE
jgi:hypothetical protein